jgi:hypothetical protein
MQGKLETMFRPKLKGALGTVDLEKFARLCILDGLGFLGKTLPRLGLVVTTLVKRRI